MFGLARHEAEVWRRPETPAVDREGRVLDDPVQAGTVWCAWQETGAAEALRRGLSGSARAASASCEPGVDVRDGDLLRGPDGFLWRALVRQTALTVRVDLSRDAP